MCTSGKRLINRQMYLLHPYLENMDNNEKGPKHFNLIINGRPNQWNNERINFSEVVNLAFPPPHKDTEFFTVQYSRGPDDNPQGTLIDGQDVKVKSGMVFDVTKTDKS